MWYRKLMIALPLCLGAAVAVMAQQDKWNELNQEVARLNREGKYSEATRVAEKSLEVAEKAFGPDNPNVAASLTGLAQLYKSQGKYLEAEPLFEQSLAIREKALGPHHPDVAASLNDLAELYRAQGRYAEAEPLYKRALPIYVRALGADNAAVTKTLSSLEQMKKQVGSRQETSECEECPQRIEPQPSR